MVATTKPGPNGHSLTPILCVTVLAAAIAGCQQPMATNRAGTPEIAAVATSDPVMLNSAAFTTGSISAEDGPAAAPSTGAAPATSATAPVPESPPPSPSAEPPASVPPAAAVRPDAYPNINVAPQEPGGQLLTPEERAKLIAELNALATRNTGGQ